MAPRLTYADPYWHVEAGADSFSTLRLDSALRRLAQLADRTGQ